MSKKSSSVDETALGMAMKEFGEGQGYQVCFALALSDEGKVVSILAGDQRSHVWTLAQSMDLFAVLVDAFEKAAEKSIMEDFSRYYEQGVN